MLKYKIVVYNHYSNINKIKKIINYLSIIKKNQFFSKSKFSIYIYSKKQKVRVILKSPFHFKLVKYITTNPQIKLDLLLSFKGKQKVQTVLSLLKKKRLGTVVKIKVYY